VRRKDVNFRSPVEVKRGVDTWVRLVHTLKQSLSGKYIVTVHNGQVIKVESVDKAVTISEMPHPKDTIPAP